jgi:hypothetical protein
MKWPRTDTPIYAAVVLGLMGLAFAYQGFSNRFPPSLLGAAIMFVGAALAIRMAMRRRRG